jgi:hypothetical protein
MNKSNEFANFDATMRELIKVPHSEIKEKLEAEKEAKKAARGINTEKKKSASKRGK